jgi:UDP-N-acetylglucosamine pyrophosphorylase
MQIFDEYGYLGFDKSIIKKAVQGIYFCLSQDNYPLVRLKAASAFHALL